MITIKTYQTQKNIKITTLDNTIKYYQEECINKSNSDFVDYLENITCFTLDNILTNQECELIIKNTEKYGYQELTSYNKNYRGNQRLILQAPCAAITLFNRVKKYLPEKIVSKYTWKLHTINPRIRFGKYLDNESFEPHKDSGYAENDQEESMLTIMFYLSSTETDRGKTQMLTLNKTCLKSNDSDCKILDSVIPVPGRCVIFNQRSIYHAGENIGKCINPKYIMRTDIIYKFDS